MVLGIEYCQKCKEDRYRVSMGYNSREGDCGRWQCHLIDIISGILIIILLIPILVAIIPLVVIFVLIDLIGGNGYAVQRPRSPEKLSEGMGRKEQRKPGMGKLPVAQRSSRTQKRTRQKKPRKA